MTRTLDEFHGLMAKILDNARRKHDARPGPGEPGYLGDESADAVTVWRRLAGVAHDYANGEAVRGIRPTWKALWADGMDADAFLALLVRRSRFLRAMRNGGDMDTMLVDDSVRYWEYSLALSIMTDDEHAESARRSGNREAARRIMLETEVGLAVVQAYTGLEIGKLRDTLSMCRNVRPVHPGHNREGARTWEAHPLFDLITANRPTI